MDNDLVLKGTMSGYLLYFLKAKMCLCISCIAIIIAQSFRLYLGIETVSCCLLQKMARMDMDCDLKKLGQSFFKLLCYACKNNHKMLWIVLSDDIICLISSS